MLPAYSEKVKNLVDALHQRKCPSLCSSSFIGNSKFSSTLSLALSGFNDFDILSKEKKLLTHRLLRFVAGRAQVHNTPPVLVAVPRTLQLPLDTKVRCRSIQRTPISISRLFGWKQDVTKMKLLG